MHLRTRSGPCVQVLPFSTSSWGKIAQIMFSSVTCSICSPRCQSDLPVNYVQETGWDMRDSWLTSACRWGRTLLWLLQRPPFQTLLGAETWGVLIPGHSRSYFEFVFKCWVIVYQNRIYMAHKTRCVRRLRNKYKWKDFTQRNRDQTCSGLSAGTFTACVWSSGFQSLSCFAITVFIILYRREHWRKASKK